MIKEKYNVDRYNNIWFQVIFQQSWQATTYTMEFKVKLLLETFTKTKFWREYN